MVEKDKKELSFVICGLGSFGKRCLDNLELLGVPCEHISIVRTRKGAASFGDEVLEKHGNRHAVYSSLAEALLQKPDAIIIANPTALHVPSAIEAVRAGCHVLITKPLSDNMDGVNKLIAEVKKHGLVAIVSYQLRFHPLLQTIKKWLAEKKIGKIYSIHAELSERVTDMHPWEDYTVSYASRKNLGGGPILSFSHEIDYLYWLFGKPKWIFASGGTLSNLNIDVEDTVKSVMQFPNDVIASLHLDFLKRPPRRFLDITGENGRIYWDYFAKTLSYIPLDGESEVVSEPDDYERNTMHVEEIRHFIACIREKERPFADLKQGKDVLDICLAMKESMKTQKQIFFRK